MSGVLWMYNSGVTMMRRLILLSITALVVIGTSHAQETVTVNPADSMIAAQLDLKAVGDLFRQSQSLEEFEKALNDSSNRINNLDLDGDGKVDFIRVSDEVGQDVHLIILQVPVDSIEYQDVATIEVEKKGDNAFDMQVHGNAALYGENYYASPEKEEIQAWPIITWIYAPAYVPYRSPYYFRFYPAWWRPFPVVAFRAYRHHINRWKFRTTFAVVHATRVRNIHRVSYVPRTSAIVEHRWRAVHRHERNEHRKAERKAVKKKSTAREKGATRKNGRRR
jgi:hypothetical protein